MNQEGGKLIRLRPFELNTNRTNEKSNEFFCWNWAGTPGREENFQDKAENLKGFSARAAQTARMVAAGGSNGNKKLSEALVSSAGQVYLRTPWEICHFIGFQDISSYFEIWIICQLPLKISSFKAKNGCFNQQFLSVSENTMCLFFLNFRESLCNLYIKRKKEREKKE